MNPGRLLAGVAVFAVASAPPAAAQAIEPVIQGIRGDVQRIERAAPRMPRRRITLEGLSTEGGVAEVYADAAGVHKVTATHFGEMGKSLEELYFRGGALIFALRRTYRYDRPFGAVQGKPQENRFYFHAQRLVRWRGSNQRLVPERDPAYRAEEAQLLRTAAALHSAAR